MTSTRDETVLSGAQDALSANNGEPAERSFTELHRACADSAAKVDDLRLPLEADREAAAKRDRLGRLPLHLVAQNQELHSNIGIDLDSFILNELIVSYPRASSTPDNNGCIPFVWSIKEWIELTHGFLTSTSSGRDDSLSLAPSRSDPEAPGEPSLADKLETPILQRLTVTPLISWSIRMLSTVIERERRSTYLIFECVASIPSFLKALLLIEDDEERIDLFNTTIVQQTMLCKDALGPWLVSMLQSDKHVAQERAVTYLEALSRLGDTFHHGDLGRHCSRPLFDREEPQDEINKGEVYTKATDLPNLIVESVLHLDRSLFERGASTGIIQFILDQKLFQQKTLFVIVLDIALLSLFTVFFILSSNSFFPFSFDAINSATLHTFEPDWTMWHLCKNGFIIDVYGSYDPYCNYYRDTSPRGVQYNNPEAALNHEVCEYTFYYEEGLVELNALGQHLPMNANTTFVGHSCPDGRTFEPNEKIYNVCASDEGNAIYDEACRYYNIKRENHFYCEPGSYYLRGMALEGRRNRICQYNHFYETGLSQQNSNSMVSDHVGGVYHMCLEYPFDLTSNLRLQVQGLVAMNLSALYFFLRHICAWFTIARPILLRKFGLWSLVDVTSIVMSLILQCTFVYRMNQIDVLYIKYLWTTKGKCCVSTAALCPVHATK